MARFIYVGDPREDKRVGEPDSTQIAGLTFGRERSTDVKDEALAQKLRGNSHFREVKVGRPPTKAAPNADDQDAG